MSRPTSSRADATAAIREHLTGALQADLIGPYDPAWADEQLPQPPSRWYVTGFLAPEARRQAVVPADGQGTVEDGEADEELGIGPDDPKNDPDEPKPKRRMLWPASLGLSVLIPGATDGVTATVSWADYNPEPDPPSGLDPPDASDETLPGDAAVVSSDPTAPPPTGRHPASPPPARPWRRAPHGPVAVRLPLSATTGRHPIPGSDGPSGGALQLEYQLAPATAPGLPPGTQALSLFVVNRREPLDGSDADHALAFQVALEIALDPPGELVPRPDHRGEGSDDEDDAIADLQYREQREWAVGHGISAEALPPDGQGRVRGARTIWLPRATVPLVRTMESLGSEVTLGMDALADLAEGPAFDLALSGLVRAYGTWIDGERRKLADLDGDRRATAEALVEKAEHARERIAEGIALLARDEQARTAFRLANRAMAMQASQRQRSAGAGTPAPAPAWRPFQLAFLLLSLPSVADDLHPDRDLVELIFFPTGGGKTEAYLGLAAVVLLLRRLRARTRPDQGLGMAVLLRYTLRLLTLDQLGRAATLICALELLRRRDPGQLGDVRFCLGLWVGEKATPNTIAGARKKFDEYRDQASDVVPCPLSLCPWCQEPLAKSSLEIRERDVRFPEVRLGCASTGGACDFTLAAHPDGLPIVFVDEQLYRELPAFVIATVDKLAMLPFRAETAGLFGRVVARDGRAFIGLSDPPAETARGERLPDGLRPPDLVIQDELHLISGPLGTMVGLYEMAVDGLATRQSPAGTRVRPKIVASTATVRRARQQITALFGRVREPAMFPPAGIDASDSFFGVQETAGHGRLYLGVSAPGRSSKAVLLRVYVALLSAAAWARRQDGDTAERADAYLTLVGYFNSLRELGGMRRLVEYDVRTRCEGRRPPPEYPGLSPWFAARELTSEPLELTSRESTQKITAAKRRLELRHGEKDAVDVALASNMISVGVDVTRLGLMVVAGQPKTTSEYIQATSRVGRGRDDPGLVVVVFNPHRPRDRSHYEHFRAYHEAFYASVEATSVTPFSGPALDRGLAGALVALTRHGHAALVPPEGVAALADHLDHRDQVIRQIGERAAIAGVVGSDDGGAVRTKVEERAAALFDSWNKVIGFAKEGAEPRVYSTFDDDCRKRKALLASRIDSRAGAPPVDEARFVAPTSMRDVEAPVHLWVVRRSLGRVEKPVEKPDGTAEK